MSRLIKKPIVCPKNVELKISGSKVVAKGPKGELAFDLLSGVEIVLEGQDVWIKEGEGLKQVSFLGLIRAKIANAIEGVSKGFEKKLTLIGVGFKGQMKGKDLELSLGYSHPCTVQIPTGLQVSVEKGTAITVSGYDKQAVGQLAATIRALRPPEPYKGKGVRYENEYVRKKAGKSAKK